MFCLQDVTPVVLYAVLGRTNVMHSNADDIKIVAKLGKGESLSFEVMQMCVKCAYLLYDVVNCCSPNNL